MKRLFSGYVLFLILIFAFPSLSSAQKDTDYYRLGYNNSNKGNFAQAVSGVNRKE